VSPNKSFDFRESFLDWVEVWRIRWKKLDPNLCNGLLAIIGSKKIIKTDGIDQLAPGSGLRGGSAHCPSQEH